MGNSTSRVVGCFAPFDEDKDGVDLGFLEPLEEGLGHSFCYVRPIIGDSPAITPSNSERFFMDSGSLDVDVNSGSFRKEPLDDSSSGLQRISKNFPETTFKTISGASVSANASTMRTGNPDLLAPGDAHEPASSFHSTASFASIPLQPMRGGSGPLNGFVSGPLERGFASGPLERGGGFMSGPLDKGGFMSGPLDADRSNFSASLGCTRKRTGLGHFVHSMSRPVRSAFSRTFSRPHSGSSWKQRFSLQPKLQLGWHPKNAMSRAGIKRNLSDIGSSQDEYSNLQNLQWAHGKAGEDRVHVVLSEEQGWLFIGIYDGFSGPDAPDFLMKNLYKAIDKELEGFLWDYDENQGSVLPVIDHFENFDVPKPTSYPRKEHPVSQSSNIEARRLDIAESGASQLDGCEITAETEEWHQRRCELKDTGAKSDILENNCDHAANFMERNTAESIEENAENAGAPVLPKITHLSQSSSTGRKSMRLFELLQMEVMLDLNNENLGLDSRRMTSCSLQTSASEGAFGESFRSSQPVSCSFRTCASGELDAIDHVRDGISVDSNGPKLQPFASFSASGRKLISKHSMFGAKLGRIYRKQKSLRKKLFRWSYDWHREEDPTNVDQGTINSTVVSRRHRSGYVDHDAVLDAMSRALDTTEKAFMEMVEKDLDKNPELALMGSCVLVMLMKDQDVYIMNLGDSRAVLAQRQNDSYNYHQTRDDSWSRSRSKGPLVRIELDRISEESPMHNPNKNFGTINMNKDISFYTEKLRALQLSTDHSMSMEEEVSRIREEHADDLQAVANDRVKGQLKVTRAFGAGFLKKAEFNDALLEMFRIEYVGTAPYLSCVPSMNHHRLCANDQFLVLSSDGLYQYFSNEEVVCHVAWFMESMPEGDPAQYLITELLFRAAKKNGMDFHELLDIPQGDRRKYHDDVSVMIISLEGRIWRSCG